MTEALVRGPWAGDGSEADPYRPRLADDYPLDAWEDVSRNPGGQGSGVTVRARCTAEVYDAIKADSTYITPPGGG